MPERISSEDEYRGLPALTDIKKTWRRRVPQRDELGQPFGLQNIRLATRSVRSTYFALGPLFGKQLQLCTGTPFLGLANHVCSCPQIALHWPRHLTNPVHRRMALDPDAGLRAGRSPCLGFRWPTAAYLAAHPRAKYRKAHR